MDHKPGLETIALHSGHVPDKDTGSRAVPLYQSSAYVFNDADEAASRFELKSFGPIYTRLGNPTTQILEDRLAAYHGCTGAIAAATGMAAIFNTIATLASRGQNFVTTGSLYGGTVTLFTCDLKRFGIEARFVDSSAASNYEARIDANTRFLYAESVGNPKGNVDDFKAIAAIAHKHGLPLVTDCTYTPPPMFDPIGAGVDVIIHSLTKIIGGHGASMGGVTIENPNFDWKASGKFPEITEADESYHGVNFWDMFGGHSKAVARGRALSMKIRAGALRNLGGAISPFNSWHILNGLETLPLRARKHCENAKAVAEWLDKHPLVEWVEYAGLPSHPDFERARKYLPLGPSAVFTFGVKGGLAAGKRMMNSVKLISLVSNILDAKSLIIHPASTTHMQLTPEEQLAAGVTPELLRLSVGIEDVEDIKADLDQALKAACG